jgi:hypothetical protein
MKNLLFRAKQQIKQRRSKGKAQAPISSPFISCKEYLKMLIGLEIEYGEPYRPLLREMI